MISIDSETSGLDFNHGAKPFLLVMGNDKNQVIIYEWEVNPLDRQPIVPIKDLPKIRETLNEQLCTTKEQYDRGEGLILHNSKFDFTALETIGLWKKWDIRQAWASVHDTLIASHVLESNRPHNLTDLAIRYLGKLGLEMERREEALHEACNAARRVARSKFPSWKIAKGGMEEMPSIKPGGKDDSEKPWKNDTWLPKLLARELNYPEDHPWRTVTANYAKTDAEVTLLLWKILRRELKRRDLWEIYECKMELVPVLYRMNRRGITVSKEALTDKLDEFRTRSKEAEELCVGIAAGEGIELKMPKTGNNKALTDLCFNVFQLPVLEKSDKTGAPSLNKDVIEQYLHILPERSKPRKFIEALRGKRKLDTSISYMEGYFRFGVESLEDWLTLHPLLNPTGTSTTRLSSSNPNGQNVCFDGATELLTKQGWIRADELTEQHEIAQYWKENGSIDFVYPKVHTPHFKGEMVHLKTDIQIDMLLTPNHRCLLKNRKTGKFIDCPAIDFKNDYFHLHAGDYIGGDKKLSYWEVVFVCAVQADGSYHKVSGWDCGVNFAFKKERKKGRIRKCLNELGIKYTEADRNDGSTEFYIHKDNQYNKFVRELMPNKQYGSWILELDRETLDLMVEEIYFWDGDYTCKSAWSSSIKRNANWVQILFSISNIRASVTEYQPVTDWNTNLHYRVNTTRSKNRSGTDNHTKEFIPWDDKVYCVTVPSSYVMIRREGKVSITGNSKQEDFTLRGVFGPPPGYEWWAIDYENIELRIPAYEADEEMFIDLFERPDDPPYFGSNHLLVCHILHPKLFEECKDDRGRLDGRIFKSRYKATWYQWTKNGNFAVQYGAMISSGTADRAYHVKGAQAQIAHRLSKIEKLSQKQLAFSRKTGYVETMPDKTVNPRRGYPLLVARTDYGAVLPTTPLSYHVQGTAGWCGIKAMLRTDPYLNDLTERTGKTHDLRLNVHDELVFQLPKGGRKNLPIVIQLRELMEESGRDIGIPLKASISYHPNNWAKEESYEERRVETVTAV